MDGSIWGWVGFNVFVLAMLALDLGVFNRKAHEIKFKEALGWSALWMSLALIFCGGLYYFRGAEAGTQFLTGYLVEKALSVDNIFVILLIFNFFKIPAMHQHKVLFWGILGALVMRALFIVLGVELIEKFHWVMYLFGGFLVLSGLKMAFKNDEEEDPSKGLIVRTVTRFFPPKAGQPPLLAALLVVEASDLVFAADSIPAILAISKDPFIVYTSNVFAILGLRSLYFAVAGFVSMFQYLHYGLAAILVFVGAKMLLADTVHIPVLASLGVIAGLLATAVAASLLKARKDASQPSR
jgi:tellurite resistance protein TerC